MPALLNLCEKYFNSKDLYEILQIKEKASEKEVKKAYHKLSLKVHPDRVNEDEKLEATEKFKVLGKIHSILSDKDKRAAYDDTGAIDEDDDDVRERNWDDYWRMIFKPITEEDIKNYEKDYIGSEIERNDIKKAYVNGKGDMDYITDHVQFARCEQEPRIIEIINKMIEDGDVPTYKMFTHEPEKKRKKRHNKQIREAKEVEAMEKEQENGTDNLALMIKQRQQERAANFDSFFDNLAAKYTNTKTKGTKRKTAEKQKEQKPTKKRKTRN